MKSKLKALSGIVALVLTGQAYAAQDWYLTGSATPGVTTTAYSNTGGGNTSTSTANNAATQTIESAAWLGQSNGYGGIANNDGYYVNSSGATIRSAGCLSGDSLTNCDNLDAVGGSTEHSIDNNQRYDMALLSFTSVVKLTQLKLSWGPNDTDVTVMAYTGTGAPALIGKTYGALSGWTVVGNYGNVGTANPATINASGVFSSYWLIGAYNPLVSGSTTGTMLTDGFDYVKLASVSGCIQGSSGCNPPSNVPEPGSLALMGIGLLGLLRMRKATKA